MSCKHCSASIHDTGELSDEALIEAWNTRYAEAQKEPSERWTPHRNRCVEVEQVLLDAANGKRDVPGRDECRKLALRLGDPTSKPLPSAEPSAAQWRKAWNEARRIPEMPRDKGGPAHAATWEFAMVWIEARARELTKQRAEK